MLAIQEGHDFEQALVVVRETRGRIEALPEVDAEEFRFEGERSEKALEEMGSSIRSHKPMSERERLEEALQRAVNEERFEDAARLRDHLRAAEENKAD